MLLVTTRLDSTDMEHSYHCRKFYQIVQVYQHCDEIMRGRTEKINFYLSLSVAS